MKIPVHFYICFILLCAVLAPAQSTPQAIQFLQRATAQSHGVSIPMSIRGQGTIDYLLSEGLKSGEVTIVFGLHNDIVFTTMIDGKERVLTIDGDYANQKEDGTTKDLPVAVAERLRSLAAPFMLPVFAKARAWKIDGSVAIGSVTAFKLSSTRPDASLLIDTTQLEVIASEVVPSDPKAIPSRFIFADYRRIDGLLLPFAVSEQVNEQTTWRIHLDNIQVIRAGSTK